MRYLFLALFIFTFSFDVISAQDDDSTRWYWAVSEADGALLSYSADGDVNRLIENSAEIVSGWRIDDQNALLSILFHDSDQLYLYHLTPTEAQPLILNFDTSEWVLPRDLEHPGYFEASTTLELRAHTSEYALLFVGINPIDNSRAGFSGYLLIDLNSY